MSLLPCNTVEIRYKDAEGEEWVVKIDVPESIPFKCPSLRAPAYPGLQSIMQECALHIGEYIHKSLGAPPAEA